MTAIFKREFKSYFISMTGFLFTAILLFFAGIFATNFHLRNGQAAFEYTVQSTCNVLLLVIPILTMRSMTEDRKAKTDRLLYSLPIKMSRIILGKYLAMLAVLAIPTLIISVYPLVLSAFGSVNLGSAYSCMVAFFLLGAALIALGMFLSALAESQVMAAILSFGATFLIYLFRTVGAMIPSSSQASLVCLIVAWILVSLIGYYLSRNIPVACGVGTLCIIPTVIVYAINRSLFEGLFPALLSKLALFNRFNIFAYGIFDIPTVVLYLSFSLFFFTLTVLSAEKKRWS